MTKLKQLLLSALLLAAPIKATAHFAFGTPDFQANSAVLDERAKEILTDAATWLERLPDRNLRIYCNRGELEIDAFVCQKRLQNAQAFLIGLGVDADRIVLVDLGASQPSRQNCKSEDSPDECDRFNRIIQLDLFAP